MILSWTRDDGTGVGPRESRCSEVMDRLNSVNLVDSSFTVDVSLYAW